MTTSVSLLAIGLLAFTVQTPTPTPVSSPKPVAPPPVTQGTQTAAARPGTIVLTVTSEKGDLLSGAQVTAHGATVDRSGATGGDGTITLQNMPAGTYRCRIMRDGYITLEKEITVKAATRSTAEASLSVGAAAPAPPPSPSPTPVVEKPAAAPMGTPGELKMMNIAAMGDQIYQTLKDTQPMADRALGCSGVVSSMLVASRDTIAAHKHADMDEIIYVLGGDATLSINDKEQVISSGWFGLVPRGASHTVAKRGRAGFVILLIQSGKPCGS